ncbi:COX assembly mitochondrial protein homolog isoform 2-T3 [Theristicus caerulescens]
MRDRAKELCSDKVQDHSCAICLPDDSLLLYIHLSIMKQVTSQHFILECKRCCSLLEDPVFALYTLRQSWFSVLRAPWKRLGRRRDLEHTFTKCCQETGLLMVVKCRQENTALKDCLVGYYSDPLFYEECKTEYLKQREEYRATGIKKKRQKLTSNV